MIYTEETGIIIVLYNPKDEDIENVIRIARNHQGVVVDNSIACNFSSNYVGNMKYISLGKNMGIAYAQNIGIKEMKSFGSIKYLLFLDQDSRLSDNYPTAITEEFKKIKTHFKNLALLGPTVVEQETGEEYKSIIHKSLVDDNGFEIKREIISSGSVMEYSLLNEIGLLLETMFIDFVDFEWCWRAEYKGYICGITKNIRIKHKVGLSYLKIWKYKMQIWSPLRYFYQVRNHLLLCSLHYVPTQWKIATAVKNIFGLFVYPFAISNGTRCSKEMLRGLLSVKKEFNGFRREVDTFLRNDFA